MPWHREVTRVIILFIRRENERLNTELTALAAASHEPDLSVSHLSCATDGDPLTVGIEEFEAEEKIQMLQVKVSLSPRPSEIQRRSAVKKKLNFC